MQPPQCDEAARGRFLLYALAIPGAVALDTITPLGTADWLIEVCLVLAAAAWGSNREMRVVAALASAVAVVGLWSSPASDIRFWIGACNRLAAVTMMCAVVWVRERQRTAEAEKEKAWAEIKVLRGLLPICAACKSIKGTNGEWHRLETYLSRNSEVMFTHSLCPSCLPKYMADLDDIPPNPVARDRDR